MHQHLGRRRFACNALRRSRGSSCRRRLPLADALRTCRSCGAPGLQPVLDLGMMPLASSYADAAVSAAPDPRYPLALVFCAECALLQTLPGVRIDDPSADDARAVRRPAAHEHHGRLSVVMARSLGPQSLVVEIDSHDGSMLRSIAASGIPVLGVESSPVPAAMAAAAGVPTITDPFDRDLATKLRAGGLGADVIVAADAISGVDDLNQFVEGLRILVADDGAIVVEMPYLPDIVERLELGAVQHERRWYFSCTSLDTLIRRHGLFLNDVEYLAEPGVGTLRCLLEPREAMTETCERFLEREQAEGIAEPSYYEPLEPRAHALIAELHALLHSLRDRGHSIAAYGAAPACVTLLNASGIGPELIDFVVERDPHRHGLRIPGVRIPICPPEALRLQHSEYLLLLGNEPRAEIAAAQADYLSDGGHLIVLRPSPKIVASRH